ncbi:hypothetical protein PRIPAC_89290 [Pristionchus pacificus]|uniref:Uncharacterized protein n=1 Tax=Pristionchus pacificus TaxID=54126 RepID=A0A2A6B669_PRIPA|nr:hypothetical protein PRIPAC_89290 [Pristionchus pacificus]|eukprot:PDM61385.1 hypothetical protein PRIPAC_50827 [Pristionchus pacificus]
MDPKDNKPSTPSRRAKKGESEYLEADECRTAVETESLTDASISRMTPPVTQSPRDAWAAVAPSSQPRIVPATNRLSQADREAEEIATSTARALQTLRNSSDPRNRLFVPQSPAAQTTPKRSASASSPFQAFSGQGCPLVSPLKAVSSSTGLRTVAAGASPSPSSVRTAAARSPDVRTGLEDSGRSARLRNLRAVTQSPARATRSDVSTALSGRATPKKARKTKGGCTTLHTATANYEIDLRQRTNSMTAPTTSVSTARTISPAARSSRSGRSPARALVASNQQEPYYDPDYPPLPCERDPAEQTVELVDQSQKYTPHIARPILFGTSGVNTARNISPGRTRTLSERTAQGDTSLKTSRSPASKSEKSVRTARSQHGGLSAGNNETSSKRAASRKASVSRSHHKSQSQSSLATTSARSFASNKSWATEPNKTPCRKNLRSAHKSASETPVSTRSPAARTAVSPDVKSSKRSPPRVGHADVRPFTPDTPKGWPYRTSDQQRQTPIRIAAPAATSVKTAAVRSPRVAAKSTKSPALRSQSKDTVVLGQYRNLPYSPEELHREAKSASSKSRSNSRRRAAKPTCNVSTHRKLASRPLSSNSSTKSSKELNSSKINARTLSPSTLKAAKQNSVAAIDNSPDLVIETVQAHGNIEIDLCFNFRVRGPPGQGFGESRSPLKPKEVLINNKSIWRQ